MRFQFILNPCSGRNRERPWLAAAIREFIESRNLEASVVETRAPGHATALAEQAVVAGCTAVVAVGGDGTMNEIAQGLVGTSTALALIPCGSGNGLALHLGVPRRWEEALALSVSDHSVIARIDTGVVNGHPFFNAMGLGFDADISRRFNRLTRRGLPAYMRVGLSALSDMRSERCRIGSPDGWRALDVVLIAITNSDQYGNHARIAPGARVDDGQLDLVAVRHAGWMRLAMLVPRLFVGRVDRSSLVTRLRGSNFIIERPAPGIIHTDGETHSAPARLEIAVRPRSLRIVVSARSKAMAESRSGSLQGLRHAPI